MSSAVLTETQETLFLPYTRPGFLSLRFSHIFLPDNLLSFHQSAEFLILCCLPLPYERKHGSAIPDLYGWSHPIHICPDVVFPPENSGHNYSLRSMHLWINFFFRQTFSWHLQSPKNFHTLTSRIVSLHWQLLQNENVHPKIPEASFFPANPPSRLHLFYTASHHPEYLLPEYVHFPRRLLPHTRQALSSWWLFRYDKKFSLHFLPDIQDFLLYRNNIIESVNSFICSPFFILFHFFYQKMPNSISLPKTYKTALYRSKYRC